MKSLAASFFIVLTCAGSSQGLDTVVIYKNKAGVSFKTYMHHWYWDYGFPSSYSWNPRRENHQDSLVLHDDKACVFKVYGREDQLLFMAPRIYHHSFKGEVLFFYSNGKIKRIETWDNKYYLDTCGVSFQLNDAPGLEGIWKYYRHNGSLRKEKEYFIKVSSCQGAVSHFYYEIRKYDRKGQLIVRRRHKIRGY